MKSTRWIAVALCLIAAPILARSEEDGSQFAPLSSEEAVETDLPRPDDGLPSSSSTQLTVPFSFDAELQQLRKDITTTKELREKAAVEASQPFANDAAVAQEQRRILLELLTKLATKSVPPRPTPISDLALPEVSAPPMVPPIHEPRSRAGHAETKHDAVATHPLISEKIVDPYALGQVLFKAKDFVGAELAFRKVKATDENRILLQYFVATCLRKQSKWDQAAKAYRTVADQKEDPTLRDLAIWQLDNIRWNQQTSTQLEELRQLRQPLETQKNSSAVGTNDAYAR